MSKEAQKVYPYLLISLGLSLGAIVGGTKWNFLKDL